MRHLARVRKQQRRRDGAAAAIFRFLSRDCVTPTFQNFWIESILKLFQKLSHDSRAGDGCGGCGGGGNDNDYDNS